MTLVEVWKLYPTDHEEEALYVLHKVDVIGDRREHIASLTKREAEGLHKQLGIALMDKRERVDS